MHKNGKVFSCDFIIPYPSESTLGANRESFTPCLHCIEITVLPSNGITCHFILIRRDWYGIAFPRVMAIDMSRKFACIAVVDFVTSNSTKTITNHWNTSTCLSHNFRCCRQAVNQLPLLERIVVWVCQHPEGGLLLMDLHLQWVRRSSSMPCQTP